MTCQVCRGKTITNVKPQSSHILVDGDASGQLPSLASLRCEALLLWLLPLPLLLRPLSWPSELHLAGTGLLLLPGAAGVPIQQPGVLVGDPFGFFFVVGPKHYQQALACDALGLGLRLGDEALHISRGGGEGRGWCAWPRREAWAWEAQHSPWDTHGTSSLCCLPPGRITSPRHGQRCCSAAGRHQPGRAAHACGHELACSEA